jgi:hypothetical protein
MGEKDKVNLTLNVTENGKTRILKLVNEGPNRFSLLICYPEGQQVKAKRQPKWGPCPDIALLAKENGFETVDIRAFQEL